MTAATDTSCFAEATGETAVECHVDRSQELAADLIWKAMHVETNGYGALPPPFRIFGLQIAATERLHDEFPWPAASCCETRTSRTLI
jgi:hypothetical protein